ncbi:hypothetical protein WN943_024429 [Citrus x changshan-huyou]
MGTTVGRIQWLDPAVETRAQQRRLGSKFFFEDQLLWTTGLRCTIVVQLQPFYEFYGLSCKTNSPVAGFMIHGSCPLFLTFHDPAA